MSILLYSNNVHLIFYLTLPKTSTGTSAESSFSKFIFQLKIVKDHNILFMVKLLGAYGLRVTAILLRHRFLGNEEMTNRHSPIPQF